MITHRNIVALVLLSALSQSGPVMALAPGQVGTFEDYAARGIDSALNRLLTPVPAIGNAALDPATLVALNEPPWSEYGSGSGDARATGGTSGLVPNTELAPLWDERDATGGALGTEEVRSGGTATHGLFGYATAALRPVSVVAQLGLNAIERTPESRALAVFALGFGLLAFAVRRRI